MPFIVVYDANVRTVAACVQQIADSRTRPPQDIEDVLGQLEREAWSNPPPPSAPDSDLLVARGAQARGHPSRL
jgi:hypothetical protein